MESRLKQQIILVTVVLLLGLGLGYLVGGRARPSTADQLHRISERMNVLESRLDADQQATRQTLEQLGHRFGSSSVAGVGRRVNSPALLLRPEDPVAQIEREAMRLRLDLEKTFGSLTAAPPNDKAPQRVNEAFVNKDVLQAPELPRSENVNCRSTMCLIRARFGPNKDGSDWTNRMLLELSDTLPNASVTGVPLPDGGTEVLIYAARAGENDPFDRAGPNSR